MMHWNELNRMEAEGGAVWRKYGRLVEQAQGATPGSLAHFAKVQFERDWQADPEALKAKCEAEEKPVKPQPRPQPQFQSQFRPRRVEPEPRIEKSPPINLTFGDD